ncbi:hypothetical protein J6590_062167 [Homalodisca vitripennis]|nr:hypothetical protein J6590_062167 [Homalodisca vitripennis]
MELGPYGISPSVSSECLSLVTNILHWSRTVLERNRCWNGKWGYCASTLHSWGYQRPATNLRAPEPAAAGCTLRYAGFFEAPSLN